MRSLLLSVIMLSICMLGGEIVSAQNQNQSAVNNESIQDQVMATVNGKPISVKQVDLHLMSRGIPQELWKESRQRAVEQMVDRALIRQFLESKKVTAPAASLERQLALVEDVLGKVEDPDLALKKLGMTRDDLQRELTLSLAWQRYAQQIVTAKQQADYFQKHQKELDGTKRKASQIFFKIPAQASETEVREAVQRLEELRRRISANELTFAQAAEQFSQSPSARQQGQMGAFTFSGQMPDSIASQAFSTPVGEMSQPFRSTFGVHLLLVTEEIPGQYSLEDVRSDIQNRLADQLWGETVSGLRKSARISFAP